MRSEPPLSYDSPPAGRRGPDGPDGGGRRTVRIAAGIALAAAAVAGVAVAWPGGGGDAGPPVLSAQGTAPAIASAPVPVPVPAGAPEGPVARTPSAPAPAPPSAESSPGPRPAGDRPLAGRVVVLDPGHNPGNGRHTAEINQKVDAGGLRKECDTTGTETDAGYTEAAFTLDVVARAGRMLTELGADVRLTWQQPRAWGPCIDERARAGNQARADAVVSVHGDGGPAGGRGFHVIAPAQVKVPGADTSAIVGPSRTLARAVAARFAAATGTGPATYLGQADGVVTRDDLGGLNLSIVPKVFIECGNMRNAADAQLMTAEQWREKAARGIVQGLTDFLTGTGS